MEIISVKQIKKARKQHWCNACLWLFYNCDLDELLEDFEFTENERKQLLTLTTLIG